MKGPCGSGPDQSTPSVPPGCSTLATSVSVCSDLSSARTTKRKRHRRWPLEVGIDSPSGEDRCRRHLCANTRPISFVRLDGADLVGMSQEQTSAGSGSCSEIQSRWDVSILEDPTERRDRWTRAEVVVILGDRAETGGARPFRRLANRKVGRLSHQTPSGAARSWAASAASPLISTLAARWRPAPKTVSSPWCAGQAQAWPGATLFVRPSRRGDHDRGRDLFRHPTRPDTIPESIGQLREIYGGAHPSCARRTSSTWMKNSTVFIGPSKGRSSNGGPLRTVSTSFSHGVRSRTARRNLVRVAGQWSETSPGPLSGRRSRTTRCAARSAVDQPSHNVGAC